jgi:hypothetical protein
MEYVVGIKELDKLPFRGTESPVAGCRRSGVLLLDTLKTNDVLVLRIIPVYPLFHDLYGLIRRAIIHDDYLDKRIGLCRDRFESLNNKMSAVAARNNDRG